MRRVRCAFGNVFIVQNRGEENTLNSLNPFSSALCLPLVQMVGFRDTTPHCHKLRSMLLSILHCIIMISYNNMNITLQIRYLVRILLLLLNNGLFMKAITETASV